MMPEYDIELNTDACFAMAFTEAGIAEGRFKAMRAMFLRDHGNDLFEGFRLARPGCGGGRNNKHADLIEAERSAFEYGLDVARIFIGSIEDLRRRLDIGSQ